ncbi:MAG: cytochrome P450 [Myxococcales bacterium]|nr:cytochrome P450 [Myxococcales bacterium]
MAVSTAGGMTSTMPPGPPPRQGLVDSLGYYYRFLTDSIGFVGERFDAYGDIYYAPSGGVGLYVLRHPDHIWEVLVRDGAKYDKTHTAFEILSRFLGQGLLTTDGEQWRRQRRMVQPAFAPKRLEGYASMMVEEAVAMTPALVPGTTVDVSREMMELTLRAVCRTLFGYDVRHQIDRVGEAMTAFHSYLAIPDVLPSWFPWSPRRRSEEAIATLDSIIFEMIAERRAQTTAPDPPDLLQMLLEARDEEGDGGSLSDREIRDQLVTLFLAGHETTSHALTWTWYLLSQNPEEEAKLHEELDRVLGGRAPTYDDYESLTQTRQVFEEAMRLYPPAYTLARKAREAATIGEYQVAAGSEVIIWIYMTHHDPRWYPDPEVFRPSRFAPEEVQKRPKLAYLPFGAGARACIGKVFAMIEGTLLLAEIAQRRRFSLAPGHPVALNPRVTLSPKHGMKMKVSAR